MRPPLNFREGKEMRPLPNNFMVRKEMRPLPNFRVGKEMRLLRNFRERRPAMCGGAAVGGLLRWLSCLWPWWRLACS